MIDATLLVTGATGCVGRAVVAAALGRGWRVRGLARREPEGPLGPSVAVVEGDVRDPAAVSRAASTCDAIVHLAGWVHRSPRTRAEHAELRASIVDGTAVVARQAARLGARLIYVSSVAVFGHGPQGDDAPSPASAYGNAKLDAERIARAACPDVLTLRPALVYGAHDRGNVARLIRIVDRSLGIVVGTGANRKAVVHSSNLADRILLGVERPDLTGSWVVADDPAPTYAEIVEAIAEVLGKRVIHLPPRPLTLAATLIDRIAGSHWVDRVHSASRNSDFSGFALDQALGYAPRVPWPKGLRTQVERWISA